MITIPWVFVSILLIHHDPEGIITQHLGKISVSVLIILLGTTAIAATVGSLTPLGFSLDASDFLAQEVRLTVFRPPHKAESGLNLNFRARAPIILYKLRYSSCYDLRDGEYGLIF
jgi:hypothetical protein